MTSSRAMRIVCGYVPNVDRIPVEARRLGLWNRFAHVLVSHRTDGIEAELDADLYESALRAVWRVIEPQRVNALTDGRGEFVANALEQVLASARAEKEPLALIVARDAKHPCVVRHDGWVNVGGPQIYHDLYVISVFTRSNIENELVAATQEECQKRGLTVMPLESFQPRPSLSLASRLRALFGVPWASCLLIGATIVEVVLN